MADDIVERLREGALEDAKCGWYDPAPRYTSRSMLLEEAADRAACQRGEIGRLRERLSRLADAADRVGIKYFDTDTMCPMVETMQTETSRARTALSDTTREEQQATRSQALATAPTDLLQLKGRTAL